MIQSIKDYIAAWNAQTDEEREDLLRRCMTPDAIYVDPHAPEPIQGIEEMQALIEKFRSRFEPQLKPNGLIDRHHHVFRLQWQLQHSNNEILSQGLMVGELTETGLIKRIIQFIDAKTVG